MMEYENQLKLQAYLDGELGDAEMREVGNWLARDREAVALVAELRHTRQALTGFERGIRLPESEDFYWSKIRREIERLDPVPEESAAQGSWLGRLRGLLVPGAAVAVLAVAGFVAMKGGWLSDPPLSETAVADTAAFTYRDYSAGATLVWLSYPADNEVAVDDATGNLD